MKHVLVLQGGGSSERDVSLRSAANVEAQLQLLGYTFSVADPASAGFDIRRLATQYDVVLPILHGAGGEDGVLQRQLEAMDKPFLGSGSAACELTFDKAQYRTFMAKHGIQMANGAVVDREQFKLSELRGTPYVLKPIDGGSSVDTLILHDISQEPDQAYFDKLFSRHDTMLLEQLIEGQELTVGVLGDEVLPVILVVPPADETFDYENKYNGRTQEIVNPQQVSKDVQQRAQRLALDIHNLTGCRHLSRMDMIAASDGALYVLETNTIPGLTEQSLLPKMAAANGVDMKSMVEQFVALALAS